jgi:hypothetical protein
MESQPLDQILEFAPRLGSRNYNTIDIYANGLLAMYTGPANPSGGGAPVNPGALVRNQYELEDGYSLQERIDFSHGSPHINYELVNPQGSVMKLNKALWNQFKAMHRVDLDML